MGGCRKLSKTWSAWLEAEQGRFALLLPVAMGAAILLYFALPAEPRWRPGWRGWRPRGGGWTRGF